MPIWQNLHPIIYGVNLFALNDLSGVVLVKSENIPLEFYLQNQHWILRL